MDRLTDTYGRVVDYLRVSLTDTCNFRCTYCVPPEGVAPSLPGSMMSANEVVRLVRVASGMGIRRVRLTGGEPLLRPDLLEIVAGIKRSARIEDLSITTNGSRLAPLLAPLRQAGLDRINISLDALDRQRFQGLCGVDAYPQVRGAFEDAVSMGFPVKLNVVAVRGLSYDEVLGFTRIAREYPVEVRFLEFMPLCGSSWRPELVIPIDIIRRIVKEHVELVADGPRGAEVAESCRVGGGLGRIGFIGSLTESFCDSCSRVRVTSEGQVRPCLFSDVEVPLGEALRHGAGDAGIADALRLAVRLKPAGNLYRERPFDRSGASESHIVSAVMKKIGG